MKHLIRLFAAGIELTLACPCNCETCGSNGGKKRPDELTVDEWKSVVAELAALGCQRISLLGGEPLLFDGFMDVAEAVRDRGMHVELITSGIGVDRPLAKTLFAIGLMGVTVSVDGTETVHDDQRRIKDGYLRAMEAIRYFDEAGLRVGVNTQVNLKSLPTLEALAPKLQAAGAMGWQLQLTMPRGRAGGCGDIAVPAQQMPEVIAVVRRLIARPGLRPFITDNIGYLTKDDPKLRTPPRVSGRCWLGCFAGLRALGIMSDGSVKGCLALPDDMIDGNVRRAPLMEIWNDMDRFSYNRKFEKANLSGACVACKFGEVCRGGCTAFALSVHGKANVSTHCLRLI